MWNFKKLPKEERENVKDLFKRGEWYELLKMHNKYRLSDYDYCCGYQAAMNAYFGKAILNDFEDDP